MEIEENPRITLMDIALHTGLSKATVSRVINNHPNVSPANRQIVHAAVRALRYRPDPALSALSKYRWSLHSPRLRNISIILIRLLLESDSKKRTAVNKVANHLAECAKKLELVFDVIEIDESTSTDRLAKILFSRGFDGVIAHVTRPMTNWSFEWKNFATVTVGYDHPAHKNHSVCSDWAGAMEIAFKKLLDHGVQRPGITVFRHQHPDMDREIEGAARTLLARYYTRAKPVPIFFYDHSMIGTSSETFPEAEEVGISRWLKVHKPDGIIDGNAIVIWWLLNMGIKVPEKIFYASLLHPGFARDVCYPGIVHHDDLQAEIAMERVINLIQLNRKGPAQNPLRTLYPCTWGEAPSHLTDLTQSKPLS